MIIKFEILWLNLWFCQLADNFQNTHISISPLLTSACEGYKYNYLTLPPVSGTTISANRDCIHLNMPDFAYQGSSAKLSCRLGADAPDIAGGISWFHRADGSANGIQVYYYNLGNNEGRPNDGLEQKVEGEYEASTKTHVLTVKDVDIADEETWMCLYSGHPDCSLQYDDGLLVVHGK